MTSRSPARAELAARAIAADDGRVGRRRVLRDHDALAGRETVGLQHHGEPELAARGPTRAPRRATRDVRKRAVGTCVPRHERLRERLARFEACGGRGRTEEQPSVCREAIGDAKAQRQLGTDDGEVDLFAIGERERPPSTIVEIDRDACARARAIPGFPGARRSRRRRGRRPDARPARARARRCRERELSSSE